MPHLSFVVHDEGNRYRKLGKAEERGRHTVGSKEEEQHRDGLAAKEPFPNRSEKKDGRSLGYMLRMEMRMAC